MAHAFVSAPPPCIHLHPPVALHIYTPLLHLAQCASCIYQHPPYSTLRSLPRLSSHTPWPCGEGAYEVEQVSMYRVCTLDIWKQQTYVLHHILVHPHIPSHTHTLANPQTHTNTLFFTAPFSLHMQMNPHIPPPSLHPPPPKKHIRLPSSWVGRPRFEVVVNPNHAHWLPQTLLGLHPSAVPSFHSTCPFLVPF